jgi:hypothetical protein
MTRNSHSIFNIRHSLFTILSFPVLVFAQDTLAPAVKLPPAVIGFVRESNIERFGTDSVEGIDSSLSHFYLLDKFLYNITREKNILQEEETVVPVGNGIVNFFNDITAPYKFSDHTIKYYKLNRRFTEVTYLQGSKTEQLLNIAYSQNLTKNWNAGLDFRRAGAEGFFRRQIFYQSSFDVYTHYETPNKRYNLFAYYLRNRMEQEENGGIKDFNPAENTVAQPTYLSSAENVQTNKELLLRQTFQLNRSLPDSVSQTAKPRLSVGHVVRYETKGTLYSETSVDDFYQYNFFDSTSTHDSTWYQRWNNELSFSFAQSDSSGEADKYSLATGHEYFLFKYGNPETLFQEGQRENFYLRGSLAFKLFHKTPFSAGGWYVFAGDYKNDFSSYLSLLQKLFHNSWLLFLRSTLSSLHPEISDVRKYSNHFIWFNNYVPEKKARTEAGIATTSNSFSLSAALNTVNNFVYNDFLSQPVQPSGTVNYYSITLRKNFTWRNWHLDNKILWQRASNESIIHLPEFMTGHSLYLEKKVFNKKLFVRIGTDLRYVSAYYADRFNPALQQFYLQETEKTGGYALVDLYVNFRIKASLFFIKAENLLDGVSGKAQFYRPDYPVTPRVIRFGLQFRFYD